MTLQRPDILAIGHAAALHINRAVYRALMQQGYAVELVVPTTLPRHAGSRDAEGAQPDDPPLHWLKLRGENLRYYRFVGLQALLEKRRPRLIHLDNEPDTALAWWLGRWAAKNDAQLTCQSLENSLPKLTPLISRGRLKVAMRALRTHIGVSLTRRHIAAVFCHNQAALNNLQRLGLGDRSHWLPLGFDSHLFAVKGAVRQATRHELGLTATTVAYFGRLVAEKGAHLLIAALADLKHLPWQLLLDDFDGNDAYSERLRQALSTHSLLERCVHFRATHGDIYRFMNAADICVVPSLWEEQFGRVASEAMACGNAVIASNRGALPEIIGTAGILVAPGDVSALRDALSMLLCDRALCAKLGLAAAQRASSLFSVEAQAQIMGRVFRQLLGRAKG